MFLHKLLVITVFYLSMQFDPKKKLACNLLLKYGNDRVRAIVFWTTGLEIPYVPCTEKLCNSNLLCLQIEYSFYRLLCS